MFFRVELQNKKDRCGEIKLRLASDVSKVDYKGKKNCFQIVTPERTYHVCAESPDEMNTWISTIKAQQAVLKGGPAAKAAGAAATPSDGPAYTAIPAAGGANPAATAAAPSPGAGQTPAAPAIPSGDAVRQSSRTQILCFVFGSPRMLFSARDIFFRCYYRFSY